MTAERISQRSAPSALNLENHRDGGVSTAQLGGVSFPQQFLGNFRVTKNLTLLRLQRLPGSCSELMLAQDQAQECQLQDNPAAEALGGNTPLTSTAAHVGGETVQLEEGFKCKGQSPARQSD